MFLPEEDAFWALAQLMVGDRHSMHGRGPPGSSGGPPCRLLHRGAGGDPPARPPTGKGPASPVASGSRSHGHPPHRLQARHALPLLPQPPAGLPACPPGPPASPRPHGAQGAASPPPGGPQPHSQAPPTAEGRARPSPSPWPAPAAPRGWGPACPRGGPRRREGAGSAGPGPQPPAHAPRGLCEDEGPRAPRPRPGRQALPSGKSGSSQGSEGGGHTGVRAWRGGPCPDTPHPAWCRRRP